MLVCKNFTDDFYITEDFLSERDVLSKAFCQSIEMIIYLIKRIQTQNNTY